MPLLSVSATDIRSLISPQTALEALVELLSTDFDPANDLARVVFALPIGSFLIMPSAGQEFAGIKIVSVSPKDRNHVGPRIQASYNLYDAQTLRQIALIDGNELTTLRTSAVSMLAIRPFMASLPSTVNVVIFGKGPQAEGHACALKAAFADNNKTSNITFVTRGTLSAESERLLRLADIVICATTSRVPLFDSSLLKNEVIVVAVGSHEPDAREVDAQLCGRSHVVVEDVGTALREAGDVIQAINEGQLAVAKLIPLKQFVTALEFAVRDRPIFFKNVGMSWEDLSVASAIFVAHSRRM